MNPQRYSLTRHGVAPIEFLMFLPVIIAFAALTMYIVRIHEAKQRATLNAEILAIEQSVLVTQQKRLANQPTYRGTDSPDLAQLVAAFQQTSEIKAGLVMGQSEVETGERVQGIAKPAGSAKAETGFLGHSWEADILPFPTKRSQQRPLTLPECIRGIAPNFGNVNQFEQLALIDGGSTGGLSGSISYLAKSQNAAIQIGKLELERLKNTIAQLEQKLTQLNLNPSENEAEIRDLENRLLQGRSHRDRLAKAL